MRLHLLEHDPIGIRHNNITTWAEKKGYAVNKTNVFEETQLPAQKDFDWLIVMGGSQHAWEEQEHPWLLAEKGFISEALSKDKIILGICLGAQLLAEALGGHVFSNEKEEIGWHKVTVSNEGKESFLFKNVQQKFLTFHWHSDHFSLPPECTRLAFSEPTINQAFIADDMRVVGFQFHPEYTIEMVRFFAKEYGHEWQKDRYVAGKEAVLSRSEQIPDTYWLMELLLNNMDREFGGASGSRGQRSDDRGPMEKTGR
jgi:GMP synthase (glutamine-hydrolysing)